MEPSQGGSLQAGREHFAQKTVISRVHNHRLVEVQHVVYGSEESSYMANGDMEKRRGSS